MKFERFYTKEGAHPFETCKWKLFTAEIKKPNGEVVFRQENVEFPEFYSQTAVNIVASKYFSGKLGDTDREFSFKQVVKRITGKISDYGFNHDYFYSGEDQDVFEAELAYMMIHQIGAFNSPVYFNIGNPHNEQQASACFIVSAEDDLMHIAENVKNEMRIFSLGSGAGSNRSSLRSSKEYIKGGGKSSGPCSFMKIYDAAASVTKSGGKSRRAAKFEGLNVDHGDIMRFIRQKGIEEKKAQALIAAGFSSDFDDPDGAYGSVNFQNSNQSVRAFNSFMKACIKDEEWALLERYPTHGVAFDTTVNPGKVTSQGNFYFQTFLNKWFYKTDNNTYVGVLEWLKAADIFQTAAEEAWKSGDPGFQFHDTINTWHTCKASGEIVASNPCSEFMFLDDTSCNLASLNLMKFINEDGSFDVTAYKYATRIFILAQEILVGYAVYPTEKITINTKKFRPLGLGYGNLGAFLLSKGIPYDSDEARRLAGGLTSLMTATAYNMSREIADKVGAFDAFEENKESFRQVILKHYEENNSCVKNDDPVEQFHTLALYEWNKILNTEVFHFRNAQVTLLAPTGTISLMMDFDTTGLEPMIALVAYKKLVGGGVIKQTPRVVAKALDALGYTNGKVGEILTYIEENGSVKGCPVLKEEHIKVFETAIGDNCISVDGHLKMMAAIQPFLSGAISKTVNLPNSATVEDVKKVYMDAWKMGLKAVALYRDGCKQSQPLNLSLDKKKEDKPQKQEVKPVLPARKKLPQNRQGEIHKFTIGGFSGHLMTGLYPNGELGEIFINASKQGSTISGLLNLLAQAVSIGLQYGVPLIEYTEQFKNTKFEPAGFTNNANIRNATSIGDYLGKYLEAEFVEEDEHVIISKEIEDKPKVIDRSKGITLDGPPCNECGGMTQKVGTCYVCQSCGTTTGCG